jgi:hypothetical protein
MRSEMTRAATEAAARVATPSQLYRPCPAKSTAINEVLAQLLFSLESPHTAARERATLLDLLDGIIRLRIDAGLLMEGRQP